jgi:hypothetical protein
VDGRDKPGHDEAIDRFDAGIRRMTARPTEATPPRPSVTDTLAVYFKPRVLIVMFLGFSSGLPLALSGSTLLVWMRESGVDLGTIGLFALVGTPYTLKFSEPLADAVPIFAPSAARLAVFSLLLIGRSCCLASDPARAALVALARCWSQRCRRRRHRSTFVSAPRANRPPMAPWRPAACDSTAGVLFGGAEAPASGAGWTGAMLLWPLV